MAQRIDLRRLDLLLDDLERWALRREKLLVTLDPRAARRIRNMVSEVATARAAFVAGGLLARAGLQDVITRAEELLEEQEDSSRVRVVAKLTPLTDLDDTAPIQLQRLIERSVLTRASAIPTDSCAQSEKVSSHLSHSETAPVIPIRREESEPPPPLRRAAPHVLARVALAPRPAPSPPQLSPQPPSPPPTPRTAAAPPRSAWTTLPHAIAELDFTHPEGRPERNDG